MIIKLSESDMAGIIAGCVSRILNEGRGSGRLRRLYRAEYENACDDLYYGYGFGRWLEDQRRLGTSMSDDEAKAVWREAVDDMASDF